MNTLASCWQFKSDSNPDNSYQTLLYTDGTTTCNCPGWTRRNPPGGRSCKHTRMVDMGIAGQYAVSNKNYTQTHTASRTTTTNEPTLSRARRFTFENA